MRTTGNGHTFFRQRIPNNFEHRRKTLPEPKWHSYSAWQEPVVCSRLHRTGSCVGLSSLTVTGGLMDGLSPCQCEFLKVFFTELCIAAVFLTFSNTQLQITVQPNGWTRTNLQAQHARNSLDNNWLTLLSIKLIKNDAKTHLIYFSYLRCYNSSLIVLK